MPRRNATLPEVPVEEFGIRVIIRKRADQPDGSLQLEAHIPVRDGNGKTRIRRRRKSAGTKDPKVAYKAARALAHSLSLKLKSGVTSRVRTKFFNGEDVTDVDCLDYYEAEIIPRLKKKSYAAYARARCKVLRIVLAAIARNGMGTGLRKIDQPWVEDYKEYRLEKGALRKDGSGEFRDYVDSDLLDGKRRMTLTTVRKDLDFLSRAIETARSYQVRDRDGRWLSAVQYNPFKDQAKRLELPVDQDVAGTPIMDYTSHERMLEVADEWDEHSNREYERLQYRRRYPHHQPRCRGFTEALLQVARQGRRREAIAALLWRDVVFPEDAERMAQTIRTVLRIRITPEEAVRVFPFGLIVWRRDSDKNETWRFAPMPQYLLDCLRRFKSTHPHRESPDGPLFYRIQDHRRASTAKNLADWFPRIQKAAGIEHVEEEGWHMWRRLFRQERQGHLSNKIVAYCGGWSRLNAVHKILDVNESEAMNRHYLQVLLRQMYACMAFDASKLNPELHIAGVSEHVLAQLRDEGYLGTGESTAPLDVRPE